MSARNTITANLKGNSAEIFEKVFENIKNEKGEAPTKQEVINFIIENFQFENNNLQSENNFENNNLQSANESLQSENNNLQSANNNLQSENESLQSENSVLKNKIENIENAYKQIESKIENIENKNENIYFTEEFNKELWGMLQLFKKQENVNNFEGMLKFIFSHYRKQGFLVFEKNDMEYLQTIKDEYNGAIE